MNRCKVKKMSWFALFCSWIQFFKHGSKRTFLFTNLFTLSIWGMAFAFFNNYLLATSYKSMAFPLFMLSLKGLISAFEKYVDAMIPYTMTKCFPLSNKEILFMRLLARYSLPSEIFGIGFLFFNFHLVSKDLFFAFSCTLAFLILIVVAEEMIAHLSYNVSGTNHLQIFLCGLLLLGFISAFKLQMVLTQELMILLFVIDAFLVALLLLLFHWKGWHISAKGKPKRANSSRCSLFFYKGKISSYRALLMKEYLFLFHHKPSIILSSLLFAGMLFLHGDSSTSLFAVPAFFMFEFAFGYGMNYLGVENQDFLPVLNASTPFRVLLRVKIRVFQVVCLLGMCLLLAVQMLFFQEKFDEVLKAIFTLITMLAILSVSCHYFSLNLYYSDKTKKKHFLFRVFITLMVYLIFTILFTLFVELEIKRNRWIVLFLAVVLVSMYFSNDKSNIFERILYRQKEKILRDLSEG